MEIGGRRFTRTRLLKPGKDRGGLFENSNDPKKLIKEREKVCFHEFYKASQLKEIYFEPRIRMPTLIFLHLYDSRNRLSSPKPETITARRPLQSVRPRPQLQEESWLPLLFPP